MNNDEGVLALQILKDQVSELAKWSVYHDDVINYMLSHLEADIAVIETSMIKQIEKEEHEELKETFQSVPYEGGDI